MTQAKPLPIDDRWSDPIPREDEYDPQWTGQLIIPKRVVIETVFGCNAKCGMCIIDAPTDRRKGIMPMPEFKRIIQHFLPYRDRIEMFDLFGLGEPLLDPFIFERVRYLKEDGFRRISISTNAHLLDPPKQEALLATEIETVLISIDGATKKTHEDSRPRTDFDRIVRNVEGIIRLRDERNSPTRFVVRYIRQPANWAEWEPFQAYWGGRINWGRGDRLFCYPVHNWSGQVAGSVVTASHPVSAIDSMPCHHIFEKLVILANGAVALCFEDILKAQFRFGNAFERDPIEIFNGPGFNKIRRLHAERKRGQLKCCRECMVLHTENLRAEARPAAAENQ